MLKNFRQISYLIISFILIACSSDSSSHKNKPDEDYKILAEYVPKILPIEGELGESSAEISGLCWYGDRLIVLPQYPSRFNSDYGKIFYINKQEIKKFISNPNIKSLNYGFFKIDISGLEDLFVIGSGFEAVTINQNNIFFTIEHLNWGNTESKLIKGTIDSVNNEIVLDKQSITPVKNKLNFRNTSDETIIHYDNKIIPIFEVYGKNIHSEPKVPVYSPNLILTSELNFPNIEYRLTDATSVDSSGRFWAINYFYPGDQNKLIPAADTLYKRFGIGKSHLKYDPVERLVQFKITENEIILSPTEPIYIELLGNNGRNWEGIAKLDDIGFILATDTYPQTILAFLPYKNP